jgi:transposase
MEHPCVVGIDVSKAHLDVYVRPSGESFRVSHDDAGFAALIARVRPFTPTVVVLEATGGYEVTVAAALAGARLPVAVVNPRQIRDFARATGQLAKTDTLDARVIALFAEAVRPIPRPLPDEQARALGELVARRRQLVDMLCAEENRRRLLRDHGLQRHHRGPYRLAGGRPRAPRGRLHDPDPLDPDMAGRRRTAALGARRGTSHVVRAHCRSAGTRPPGSPTHCRPCRLAPVARDSGAFRGRRMIVGGRAHVRRILYMATVAAIKYNPVIRAFFHRLVTAGRPAKVAVIAAMRKLLTILNAMLRDRRPWQIA